MKKKTSRGAAAAGSRPAKVGELIRQELSTMFQDGWVRDPRFGRAFVTVTGVTMSADLSFGTAHISVYSEDKQVVEGVMGSLRDSARDLRRELGRRLTIRHTPDLRFSHDGSAAYGEKMERLLKDIRGEVKQPIVAEDTDTDDRTDPDIGAVTDDFADRTNPDTRGLIEDGEDTPAEGLPPVSDEAEPSTVDTLGEGADVRTSEGVPALDPTEVEASGQAPDEPVPAPTSAATASPAATTDGAPTPVHVDPREGA